ncbi:ATP-dependent RNA helicase DHX33 [Nematostella vectensis]|uniref:ATP-dependent RNA helicase DHX33 n=1 Tax=Nematostella vectensis TaxID=45351 RepID=UPI0020779501|nr:ATP-dependent RNA helicase DHX33 [Nematostella vectensis]
MANARKIVIPGLKRSFSESGSPLPAKRAVIRSSSASNGGEQNGHTHASSPIQRQKLSLPIFSARKSLITEIRNRQNVIIVGETGSGKTTQIPQYLYEAKVARNSVIACAQPRRVAAISIAQRVSREMGVQLGEEVGYTVRFEDVTSTKTRIKYMTDGMLLRESVGDSLLKRYSVIILDEAHERTIHTDVLFGIVKGAQISRKERGMLPLKIVVMSATLEAHQFSEYFGSAEVLYIEGRQHPVELMYAVEPQVDYMHAALITIMQLHQEKPLGGDILVFLTGQDEIESLSKLVSDCSLHCPPDCPQLLVCPMFAALPSSQQMQVFRPAIPGARKVILSTNIAETSVTIPGVKYVIDTGYVKAKGFHPKTGLDMLRVQPVSKAQARQRLGRAGRECSGVCYRLYTEEQFEQLAEATVPEIQRCNLSSVILQLMALGIPDIASFDFMDKPSADAIDGALKQLVILEALQEINGDYKLTSLGQKMAQFPLEPRLAKVILASETLGCSEEILTVVALLSVDSITYTPQSKRDHALKVRKKFLSSEGDQITLLNIYRAYKQCGMNKSWCAEHFINTRVMKLVMDIRKQLREICIRLEIKLQSCGKDSATLRQCLCRGLFMNSAELQLDGTYQTLNHRETVAIHPSSSLFMSKPAYVVYNELVHTSKCYMRDVSVVSCDWLLEAAPGFFQEHRLKPRPTAVMS